MKKSSKKIIKQKSKKVSKKSKTSKPKSKKIKLNRINSCGCYHNPNIEGQRFTFDEVKHILFLNGLKIEKLDYGYKIYNSRDPRQKRFAYDLGGVMSEGMNLTKTPWRYV